jgi:hypothetical protein
MDHLRHAFAVDTEPRDGPVLPDLLERLARRVVERRMEAPAIAFLEMVRPLNLIGSQVAWAAVPFAGLLADDRDVRDIAAALEDRRTLCALVQRIETLSAEQRP